MPEHVKVEVCLIGEAAVGKTSLISRYARDQFDDKYIQTLGSKVTKHTVTIPAPDGDGEWAVDLMLWDIMGQPDFRLLLQEAYFDGARGALAVCDVTRQETLAALDEWMESVYRVAGTVPAMMLGNKADLDGKIQVEPPDLEAFAAKYDAPWAFSSARTGENVARAFEELARRVVEKEFVTPVA